MGFIKGGDLETAQFIDAWTLETIDYCDYITNPPLNPSSAFYDAYRIVSRNKPRLV
jgi:hypothetical protein